MNPNEFDAMFGDAVEVTDTLKLKSKRKSSKVRAVIPAPVSQLSLDGWEESQVATENVSEAAPDFKDILNGESVNNHTSTVELSKIVSEEVSESVEGNLTAEGSEGVNGVIQVKEQGTPKCEVFRGGHRLFVTYDKMCVPKGEDIYSMLMSGHEVRLSGIKVKKRDYAKYGPAEDDEDD